MIDSSPTTGNVNVLPLSFVILPFLVAIVAVVVVNFDVFEFCEPISKTLYMIAFEIVSFALLCNDARIQREHPWCS